MILVAVLRLEIHGIHVGQVGRQTGQHDIGGSYVGVMITIFWDVKLCSQIGFVVSEEPNGSFRLEGLIKICYVVSEMRHVNALIDGDNLPTLHSVCVMNG
jgi:hypothetical protein